MIEMGKKYWPVSPFWVSAIDKPTLYHNSVALAAATRQECGRNTAKVKKGGSSLPPKKTSRKSGTFLYFSVLPL